MKINQLGGWVVRPWTANWHAGFSLVNTESKERQ